MTTQIGTLFPGKGETNPDLVNVIRTDARFSTRHFRHQLVAYLQSKPNALSISILESDVKDVVHTAYSIWGTSVVQSLKEATGGNEDYPVDALDSAVEYHLHDAQKLSNLVVSNAREFDSGCEPLLVSLDDIISSIEPGLDEVAFSRLFSMDGTTYSDFVARPGRASLSEQFNLLKDAIEVKRTKDGMDRVPLVLLEDNVRHARMLNWLFDQMEQNGVLDNAKVVGISSCFCCASDNERQKIISKNEIVPVTAVVDYHGAKIDVITPRDLLFDGFVVDIDGDTARLPGIFMDVKSRFNIEAEYEQKFLSEVVAANREFCRTIEDRFGVVVPMEWFATVKAMSHVTGMPTDSRMIDVLNSVYPDNKVTEFPTKLMHRVR